ncbi:MAG TPA: TIM-barrel domain-containing protein [Terriglobales bacterium]|nr:TIM-barrel domain-containing protein [Terriglobales bacterium]
MKIMRPLAAFVFALLLSAFASASWESLGNVTAVEQQPHAIILTLGKARLSITAINDSVIRVRVAPSGAFPEDYSWAVVSGANTPSGNFNLQDSAGVLTASTPELTLRIEKSPLRISFFDTSNQIILQEDSHHPVAFDGGEFRVYESMPQDEHYYGLGDHPGPLDRRGLAFTHWNTDTSGWQESDDPLYKTIPFFIGLRRGRAYGIFLDNTWRSSFDFGKELRDAYSFGSDGGELNYYFIYGPHPKAIIQRYADLTGRMPLPPLWALAYQQSRYSYYPEARVREIARTFRDKRIPADVIYLDIDYQQNNRPFTVNRERFPHFEQMIRDLRQQGFRIVLITDLHVAQLPNMNYKPYDEGIAGNYFVHNPDGSPFVGVVWPGPSVFPDFTWAPAREWWGTLYQDFVADGAAGFWNDMNEPSVFFRPDKTMPLDTVHRMDSGGTATHRQVHNIFGLENTRGTYEGLLKLQPNTRPFVLTRASYAGGQRYAASWTGDNCSTWNHYRISIPTLLNLGLSGFTLIGDDIGGYKGSPPPDLLTRWFELGTFNPFFRDHTEVGSADQEPWAHGPEHEAIRRRYIELRYKLMPYIYTSVEASTHTGFPLMRPVFLEYPDLEFDQNTSFFFGPDLFVSPQVDETLDAAKIALPTGDWYDYWTGLRVDRAALKPFRIALDQVPLYVRAGAIIPQQPLVQSTAETPQGPLELRVYPGPNCQGRLYLDDGTTFNYKKGEFLRAALTCEATPKSVALKISAADGSYQPWFQSLQWTVFGAKAKPARITVNGQPLSAGFDEKEQSVTFTTPYTKAAGEIVISY